MAKAGLDDLTAILSSACGDLIQDVSKKDGELSTLRVNYGHRALFKQALRDYVAAYGKKHKVRASIAFPNAFTIRLRVLPRTSRSTR